MHIRTISVTRAEHIEPSAFYLLCGTTDGGKIPIPPQVIQVRTNLFARTMLEVPTFEATIWLNPGPDLPKIAPQKITIGLWDVNIPEHGTHDRHLRRIPDDFIKMLERLTGITFYQDIATDLSMYRGMYKEMHKGA